MIITVTKATPPPRFPNSNRQQLIDALKLLKPNSDECIDLQPRIGQFPRTMQQMILNAAKSGGLKIRTHKHNDGFHVWRIS